jgi:predicted phage baseplate assembly protein
LPTGLENVRAEYRNGIGAGGNVKAGQISVLVTRPLGLREVTNPLPSSGGADRETRDQARKNAPLVVRSLDRLVSVRDYADFARTFAGIGKASAVELSNGSIDVVHLTIAGVGDIPIDPSSDLFQNLRQALFSLGDPLQEVRVATREVLTVIISARIRRQPDYPWQDLEARVRARLLDAFGFERRELAQSITSSEVLGVIQSVRGVEFVDLEVLDAVSESELVAFLESQEQATEEGREAESLLDVLAASATHSGSSAPGAAVRGRVNARSARPDESRQNGVAPAELAYLSPAVPDSLVLNPIEDR